MTDDSVRYYVSPNLKGAEVAILKFAEKDAPRLVPAPANGPAESRFWIEVASGTVRQTELAFPGKSVNIRATVNYAAESKLGVWLPVEMYQQVDVYAAGSGISNMGGGGGYGGHQGLEGRATYAKFRQVPVDLSKIR